MNALNVICRDSLEMTLDEALAYPRGSEITDAVQDVATEIEALRAMLPTKHHARCFVHRGKTCDCYFTTKHPEQRAALARYDEAQK